MIWSDTCSFESQTVSSLRRPSPLRHPPRSLNLHSICGLGLRPGPFVFLCLSGAGCRWVCFRLLLFICLAIRETSTGNLDVVLFCSFFKCIWVIWSRYLKTLVRGVVVQAKMWGVLDKIHSMNGPTANKVYLDIQPGGSLVKGKSH